MTFEEVGIEGIDYSGPTKQKVTCPKCSSLRKKSNERCLLVNVEKQNWFCFHCGWYGRLEDNDSKKSIVELIDYPEVTPARIPSNTLLKAYFLRRKISEETLKANDIFISELNVIDPNGEKRQAIAFPYYLGDKIINVKYKTVDKQFQMVKGAPLIFYRINEILFEEEVIITEGEIDALSYVEAGFNNAISVPSGAPPVLANSNTLDLKYINHAYEILKDKKKFYISTDQDAPGRKLRDELARRLGKGKCYIVKYPQDCKDANDVLVKYGAEALAQCIKEAEPFPLDGAITLKDFEYRLDHIYQAGFEEGIKSGFSRGFDKLLRFYPGMLTVVTGIPNHGKSPFVDQLALSMAINNGWKSAFFSPENGAPEIHATRLVRQYAKKPLHGPNRMSEAEYKEAKEFVKDNMFFVFPRDTEFSIDNILELFEYFVAKNGVKLVVLDPWNTIEHQSKSGESETQYIGRILNKFKYFARDHDVHFIVVSHPVKLYRDKETRVYEVPTLYSISGSANWYNIPECGITVYRRFDMGKTDQNGNIYSYNEIHIQKVKFDFMGNVGMTTYEFDVPSQRFVEKII